MKKTGFTLIELMGVIIIIALITVIATPHIVDQIRKTNTEVSKTQLAIIEAAADNYLSLNTSQFKLDNGRVYCITLQELIDADMLVDPVVDVQTQEVLSNTTVIEATVKNNSFQYELLVNGGTCTAK